MVLEKINSIKVKKTNPKQQTGKVELFVVYNDIQEYYIDIRNDSINKDLLIFLFGYYYILDRIDRLDVFYKLIDMCDLIVTKETYRMFEVQYALSTKPYSESYISSSYEELESYLNINWDSIDPIQITNIDFEYIDTEIP